MPAFYTHYTFAKKLYSNFSNKLKDNIDYDYFLLFAQSFDIFYYDFGMFKKNRLGRQLAHDGHRIKRKEFFDNILKFKKQYPNNTYINSFLYGTLSHYILDATFHPYIFYKTGTFKKKNKETYKYSGLHTKFELLIDEYFYRKESNGLFYKEKFYKLYNNIKNPPIELINFLDLVFYETFQITKGGKRFFKCLKKWYFVNKHIKYDPLGFKRIIYKFIDFIKPNKYRKIVYYSFYTKNLNVLEVINGNHNTWFNPANKSLKYNYDVDDLFNISLNKYLNIIKDFNNIPNISYFSGLEENSRLKYFEF